MNQTFSLKRFKLLLNLELSESGRSYLLTFFLFLALICAFVLPILLSKENNILLIIMHIVGLVAVIIFGGSFYTASSFSKYASPERGIAALMIPASRFEKYSTILLLNVLLQAMMLIVFVKLHYWTIETTNSQLSPGSAPYRPIPRDVLQYIISWHLVVQGAMFLGSIYYPKLNYIKTAAFLLVWMLAITFASFELGRLATNPGQIVAFPFTGWTVWEKETGRRYIIEYPHAVQSVVFTLPILFLISTWYIAYVRLCEKEI